MQRKDSFINEIKERCTYLHDMNSFKENLLMPLKEFIPHDASGVTLARGAGFDSRAIHYGYPPGYLASWTNQNAEKVRRWKRHLIEGEARGYSTLRSIDYMENFQESKEYEKNYQSYGQKDAMQTMFFSSGGSPLGIYACNRFSEGPCFSEKERALFDAIAPYQFYAFRKYKWLLDFDFFSEISLEESIFGVVTTDHKGTITWMNETARNIMKDNCVSTNEKLPRELKTACQSLKNITNIKKGGCNVFRDIEAVNSYGSVLCYRFNDMSSKHLPIEGDGTVFFVEPRDVEKKLIDKLSQREREIAICFAMGMGDKEISSQLSISVKTIQTLTQRLFIKLEVSNRTEAAVKVVKLGLA